MDLSKLSDADLMALQSKQYGKLSNEGLTYLHQQNQNRPMDSANAHPQGESTQQKTLSPQQEEMKRLLLTGNPRIDKGVNDYTPQQLDGLRQQYEMGQSPVQMAAGAGLTKIFAKPLRAAGDLLMQKAVGMGKLIPGFGEKLADEGLIGTKNMITKQIESGLDSSGKKITDLAAKIPGKISQDPVANKIAEIANNKISPEGFSRPESNPVINKALSRAQDFAQSEPISGSEMASRRAMAGQDAREAGAYRSTNPSQAFKAQMASREQAGYSQALKDAYSKSFPGETNALADADQSYSTLATAQNSIDKPESINGLKMLLKPLPTTTLQSVGGRAAIGTGKAIESKPTTSTVMSLLQRLQNQNQ